MDDEQKGWRIASSRRWNLSGIAFIASVGSDEPNARGISPKQPGSKGVPAFAVSTVVGISFGARPYPLLCASHCLFLSAGIKILAVFSAQGRNGKR